jgi:hypothetical protein
MNIFILNEDAVMAAKDQCDKHVVKMPLESAQMLCTIAITHGHTAPYRMTHRHHPCTVWAGSSRQSFDWLVTHGLALCAEYKTRYGKEHKSKVVIDTVAALPLRLPTVPMPSFAQAMPEQYRQPNAVAAYRAFYRGEKARFATWKGTPPIWWV